MDEWALILNDRIIKRFRIKEGQTLTIGRDNKEADVAVDNTAISRRHCSLELKGGNYYLTDLYSLNGTKVNGKKVVSAVPIKKTDFIEISKFTLQPTETILAEQTAESYAISSNNDMDQTVFVNAKPKPQARRAGGYRLKLISGKGAPQQLELAGKNSIKVGRDQSCDLVISGFLLSKTQFFITRKASYFSLIPLGSIRKTYLNGKVVGKETRLNRGDEIKTAGVTLKLE
ncbi:MAG: FHA domain-containing protein [Desulfurivibrionaceae bacterium]|nr:FHA domain-containing protein [Desulfobulbales bacterium]MDT8334530.1 FHA domain-containing protein [Desulfurivibrionaceae bacterium]